MLLDKNELFKLTHKRRPSAQVRALRTMGIEHKVRPDGTVAVLKVHVEDLLGGTASAESKIVEPDWSAI